MPEAPEKFNAAMTTWQEWQDAPWGRLRYAIAEANLARHLDDLGDGPLRILDLAGGDGGDAMRLAARGHHVTVVDHAPAMLAAATERASTAGLTELITCVRADVTALPADLAAGAFDVVLCHNLLQYVDDVPGILATALAPLKPGGLFSMMAINRHSAALSIAVRETDPAAALAALGTDRSRTQTFDSAVTLHTAERSSRSCKASAARTYGTTASAASATTSPTTRENTTRRSTRTLSNWNSPRPRCRPTCTQLGSSS
ncbi:class I SAM-dependent methyltransferase [Streptomyces sp. NPDC052043]|uniref:class I SAM-dependent methyltransferase n=1 Tax=Streptomyces sp. NPDC052043 TaxID=3365684 RepID=UPI0037D86A2A